MVSVANHASSAVSALYVVDKRKEKKMTKRLTQMVSCAG
jgi:hypothetical protein